MLLGQPRYNPFDKIFISVCKIEFITFNSIQLQCLIIWKFYNLLKKIINGFVVEIEY